MPLRGIVKMAHGPSYNYLTEFGLIRSRRLRFCTAGDERPNKFAITLAPRLRTICWRDLSPRMRGQSSARQLHQPSQDGKS